MNWKKWVGLVVFAALVFGGYRLSLFSNALLLPNTEADIAAVKEIVSQQNEEAFYCPERKPFEAQPANPLKSVYFGDLHIHTSISSDAYLFGNRMDMDTAYRIAKGASGTIRAGERIELTRPLDFAALTDHAETFGRRIGCDSPDLSDAGIGECNLMETPSIFGFLELRGGAQQRPPVRRYDAFNGDPARERNFAADTWQQIQEAADRHYQPGKFTTFAAYEYSPALPDRGKHHRNIVFRLMDVPKHAVASFDAMSEIELWKELEATCENDCQFLTIPHNPNKTWGLAFSGETIDGAIYTEADWRLRERNEPLVEMLQIKGNSECSVAFGAGDEECGYEQFFPAC